MAERVKRFGWVLGCDGEHGGIDRKEDGGFVRFKDYERVEKERDELLSAIKQHCNATEDRLRKLGHREAGLGMLSPDRHLYEAAEAIEGNSKSIPSSSKSWSRDTGSEKP